MELNSRLKSISDGLVALSKKRIKKLRDKERTLDRDNWRGAPQWPSPSRKSK